MKSFHMDEIKKPILYNGYLLSDNLSVIRRIAYESLTEVYELSNGEYLYLFTHLTSSDIKNNSDSLIQISVGSDSYIAHFDKHYSRSRLSKILESLTTLKGFSAVAGMEQLKQLLLHDVIGPLQQPERYKRFKVPIPSGVLLFGPPGCGKTFIVRKLAEEINYNFVEIKHSDITSSYVHGTVDKVSRLFEMARAKAPSIVFIDEIDGLVPRRESLSSSQGHKQEEINELLMWLNDAGKQGILVVAATNQPQLVDQALLRPGRMDIQIYVSPPDFEARQQLLRMFLDERPLGDIDFIELAKQTENYTSADLEYIANESAREALISGFDTIEQYIIEKVISETPPSISEEDLIRYEQHKNKQRF